MTTHETVRPLRGPGSGNKCGHDPDAPRLTVSRELAHEFLNRVAAKVRGYYVRPSTLPPVARSVSDRWLRSEAREAVALVLQSMILRMDVITMRVGKPTEKRDGWEGAQRLRHIRRDTGLSRSRIDRTIHRVQTAGLVRRDGQPRERKAKPDGSIGWRGHAARRSIELDLFAALGMLEELRAVRAKVYETRKRAGKIERRRFRGAMARQIERLAAARAYPPATRAAFVGSDDDEPTDPLRRRPTPPPTTRHETIRRRLEAEHPDWSPERTWQEALDELERGTPPPPIRR